MEVTTQRVTTVESIPEAFSFIMECLDTAGPEPRIEFSPFVDLFGGIQNSVENPDEAELLGKTLFEVRITSMEVQGR